MTIVHDIKHASTVLGHNTKVKSYRVVFKLNKRFVTRIGYNYNLAPPPNDIVKILSITSISICKNRISNRCKSNVKNR